MILLIDLDGTLTDTAHLTFKQYKDGLQEIDSDRIPLIKGATEFVSKTLKNGHKILIVSDSHPIYVNKIANEIFKIPSISLADKPNVEKTLNYLQSNLELKELFKNKDNFIMIGDSYLDIELARRLNISSVLTKFYKATNIEKRDGIGQDLKAIKMGPTYYAKTFDDLYAIIQNPIKELLSLEAIFQGKNSDKMVKYGYYNYNDGFMAIRCLARQEDGECDRFSRSDKYYEIDNPNRSKEFVSKLAQSVSNYLSKVEKFPEFKWDYLTYISDKKTTDPPNKMREIFELINSRYNKIKIFEWADDVKGKLRYKENYQSRRDFISKYIKIIDGLDIVNKNIIIIDDQLTTAATANEICLQLRNKGAKNTLFVALFYLISTIESKLCPKCGMYMKIKINRQTGRKFYACVPPKYRGNGCGYTENIIDNGEI